MKMIRMEISNFRQFCGSHEIVFSTDEVKNVTVIHGENGSGKTSLLNAFKWCFYGETDFDTVNENILNDRAIANADENEIIKLKIKVTFENDGKFYIAERWQEYIKKANEVALGGHDFILWIKSEDGQSTKSGQPGTHMNQLLPLNMHPYFFFNGERIEKLASATQSIKIQTAIKNLMGLEIVERASHHLRKYVKKYFNDQLKNDASEELKELYEKENTYTEELDDHKENKKCEECNILELESEINDVNSRLGDLEESSALQNEREEKEIFIGSCNNELKIIAEERKKEISKKGFFAFNGELFKNADEILEENRKKGELPYKIKEQFIDDILEKGVCICGNAIALNSPEYVSISSYRKNAGNFEMESEFIDTSSKVKRYTNEAKSFLDALREYQLKEERINTEKEAALSRLDELSYILKDINNEDISRLEERRESLEKQLKESREKIGYINGKIKEVENHLIDVREQTEHYNAVKSTHSILEKRKATTNILQVTLDNLLTALSDQVRKDLSRKVNETFQNIIRKPYQAEIDDDYTLQIYKITENTRIKVYEKSTGENQVTSLSFVGSIINQAKERFSQEQSSGFYRGGLFPLVMDSPFGALDEDYRKKIAHYIPNLAEQVIIMVSNSQWDGVVKEQCMPKIGSEHTLVYYSPNIKPEDETHYVKYSSGHEYTEIREH